MITLYRFEHKGIGVYQAVNEFCSSSDIRRKDKPDGSWLIKIGPKFPGAISFWTPAGLRKYKESGLLAWHQSALPDLIIMKRYKLVGPMLYSDELQVIANPSAVQCLD